MLVKIADFIKPNIWINVCNPKSVDFWKYPWYFNTLFALQPTFIILEFPLESLKVNNFLQGNVLVDFLGCIWIGIDCMLSNLIALLLNIVFGLLLLNQIGFLMLFTIIWTNIVFQRMVNGGGVGIFFWKLHIAPQVKVYIWRMLHGHTLTYDFLHNVNIGPPISLPFVWHG